jgi:prolyl oligopeptidase
MCPVALPFSPVEPVTEILHGVPITDPYRWLEDQNSPRTRAWIEEQQRYARAYLDRIPGRERIREGVRELLDVATCDSFLKSGTRYFFRKRLRGHEQPSIYFREGPDGDDQLLVDPASRGTGDFTAVKPLRVSADGSLLLYEVKQSGERMGTFEILDVASRKRLPDSLPRGYLRGFAFAPDGKSFYYVHEAAEAKRLFYRAAYHHVLGTSGKADREIFCAGEDERFRLLLLGGRQAIGFVVLRFLEKTYTDFYLFGMGSRTPAIPVVRNADYVFEPRFQGGRILAAIDRDAPNRTIVDVQPRRDQDPLFFPFVVEGDSRIHTWHITAGHVAVTYIRNGKSVLELFDSYGKHVRTVPADDGETLRIAASSPYDDELLVENQSFVRPPTVARYSISSGERVPWLERDISIDASLFGHQTFSFPAKDGVRIPMTLFGKKDSFATKPSHVLMTAYGGHGISVTPQFSVLVTLLVESGCLFALPNIRGGAEFGTSWHEAARRHNRLVAIDDFLGAAEWLGSEGRSDSQRLAIFGGSNSGLLVAAAMTRRPDLFRAVLCMVPLTDMLRYHRFGNAYVWREEYGVAENPDDFLALSEYSPYHHVRPGTPYPATMIVSGDADQNCDPLHARKMAARLQAANASNHPILLDYHELRGHSPVLPLHFRIEALTDRAVFFLDQLQLTFCKRSRL